MKIAIVAPSPVPFAIGGAEKLWWGLQNHINQYTSHQCELIKIPVKENNFWNLMDAYYRFHQLDVSSYDLVITGKYPSWMVRHDNHCLYMLHCLRGLYDTYHFTGLPLEFSTTQKAARELLDFMTNDLSDIDAFFHLLFGLRNDSTIPSSVFDFPGPFVRKIIHFLDKKAMKNVNNFAAISLTVANRKEYFPVNADVKTIYPPSNLHSFKNSSCDYFFTASRLDEPKRVKMIVEAYLQSNTSIPLKIAGTGPAEDEIKTLAKGDNRIEFLGYISDEELIEYYAKSYAVIFIPYEEDYGLITIEAMMSEKPVITFTDCGGVTEFVEDGKSGFISDPTTGDLKKSIEKAATSKEQIIKMGRHAKLKVKNITWENSVKKLLNINVQHRSEQKKRKKITVVTTYPVFPPRGGGQNRVYYLYKELAAEFDIEVVSLAANGTDFFSREIASGLTETRVPKSVRHAQKEWRIEKKVNIPITDIAFMFLFEETPAYIDAVVRAVEGSEFVIMTQPYLYGLLKKYTKNTIIHDSQNVEYLLKQQMLPKNRTSEKLLKKLFEHEKQSCRSTQLTMVCTLDDAKTMKELYGLDERNVIEVPNGVDLDSVNFTTPADRMGQKRRLNLERKKIALFIASWHQPNIDAIEKIFLMAMELPEVYFLVVGSAGLYFSDKKYPANVGFSGVVDDDEKNMILSVVDIALNPMESGSGTNLKMLDYIMSGIPVVTTEVGARGLNLPEKFIKVATIGNFVEAIKECFEFMDEDILNDARLFVEKKFSWENIVLSFRETLQEIML